MIHRIIIIGGGIAGITAVKSIRETDKDSEIIIFGEEKFYPYYRIKLSKNLLDDLSEDNVLVQKKAWYEENKVNIYAGKKVQKINPHDKEVVLSDGNIFKYDKLLLANGARNNKPPIDGIEEQGVFTLRTLQDAWNIRNKIKNDDSVINIGGGVQGLETVWSLHKHNIKSSIVEIQPRLMSNQLDERASQILQQSIEKSGVKIYLNTKVEKIQISSKIKGIITNSGEFLSCEKIIYSAGIKPNIEIVQNTPVECKKGIVVNEKMKTNIEDVYAAGDVAEFNNSVGGLWSISMAQGKVAGYNIAGGNSTYKPIVPMTTLNAFDLSLFSMGCINESKSTDTLIEENNESEYTKIFFRNNIIIGAIVIGNIKPSSMLKLAIEKELALQSVDFSKITVNQLLNNIQLLK